MVPRRSGERGSALVEFALVLPLLLTLFMLVVELGLLINGRLIVTNVSREGGSIGSRMTVIDNGLLLMLESSGFPLNLGGTDGRIIVTRVTSGDTEDAPNPRIVRQLTRGALGVSSTVNDDSPNLGLTEAVYNRLVFDPDNGTADIAEVTVVEIYFKHRPVTPMQRVIRGLVLADGDGTILSSRAVF
jgi:Flp pilus assembly protein TadG